MVALIVIVVSLAQSQALHILSSISYHRSHRDDNDVADSHNNNDHYTEHWKLVVALSLHSGNNINNTNNNADIADNI